MARVLAYTSPARGDLYPLIPILDELRRRGHEVHVRALAAEVERLAARGFTAKPIDEAIEAIRHDDWKAKGVRAALAAATAVFVARAPHDARDLRGAIDALDPDVVVLDINAWGAMAVAEGSGRPWAAVAPYPLPISSRDAPPFGPGLAPARGPLGRLRDAIVRPLVIGAIERAILPKLNAVRAAIDPRLSPVRTADDLYSRPPLLLYLTAEPFEYNRRSWPGNVRMVGPCSWEPELEPPAWLDAVTPPVVLVATSSEYQADAILAQTAFDALAGTEMTIIATLPSNDPGALRVPPNGRPRGSSRTVRSSPGPAWRSPTAGWESPRRPSPPAFPSSPYRSGATSPRWPGEWRLPARASVCLALGFGRRRSAPPSHPRWVAGTEHWPSPRVIGRREVRRLPRPTSRPCSAKAPSQHAVPIPEVVVVHSSRPMAP